MVTKIKSGGIWLAVAVMMVAFAGCRNLPADGNVSRPCNADHANGEEPADDSPQYYPFVNWEACRFDGFCYATNADKTIIITEYKGSNGNTVIPSTINGLPVTCIRECAFLGEEALTNATIPASITNIGDFAFAKCGKLVSITVDSRNSAFSSVDGILFDKNQTALIQCPLGKEGVEDYSIPNGVRNIECGSFEDCRKLKSVTIPQSVTNIGSSAFSCCSLTSMIIPDSVISIDNSAFQCCPLTDVTIGTNVAVIGSTAFNGCNLTTVMIPARVVSIADSSFIGCHDLTAITVDARNACYSSINGVLFDKNQTKIILYPTKRNGRYTIPKSVTCIGNETFQCNGRLTGVTIPYGVTNIGEYAFAFCNLTSVELPDSVIQIGAEAFYGCLLKSVTIPDSVISIRRYAFKDCKCLTHVTIGKNVAIIDYYGVFDNCTNLATVLFKGNAPKLVLWEGGGLRPSKGSIFDNSDKVTVYYLPGTTGWTNTFGGRPTAVWTNALPERETIAEFSDTWVEQKFDFKRTSNGKTITIDGYEGTNTVVTIPASFDGLPVTDIEWYPHSKLPANLFSVIIPKSVTSLGSHAFFWCCHLASITIPDSVTNIGDYAFESCTNLASVTIPGSVTRIGSNAFCCCTRLSSINIPDSVTSIGADAFCSCVNLSNVTMSQGITNIGDSAFFTCGVTNNITIPSSVTHIGSLAFYCCRQLTGIYFKGDAPSLGDGAFRWDDQTTIYHLPGTTGWSNSFGGRPTAIWTNAPAENDFAPESVCECLSPYNDADLMKEWGKVETRLKEKGVSVSGFSSVGALFCTIPRQANDAREIIRRMIKDKEVDAEKLQLRVIDNRVVTKMAPPD